MADDEGLLHEHQQHHEDEPHHPPQPAQEEFGEEEEDAEEPMQDEQERDAEDQEMQEEDEEGEDNENPDDDIEEVEEDAEEEMEPKESEAKTLLATTTEGETGKPNLQEATYSTRGRSTEPMEQWERTSRDAVDNLGRNEEKLPAAGTMRESFLSDSLTEEERRTRTRYLPAVEGIHALRKNEIKGDIALARAMLSSAGTASTLTKSKRKRGTDESDSMDVDDYDGVPPSEDEKTSDALRSGSKTLDVGSIDLVIPSPVFVASVAAKAATETSSATMRSPAEVEAVTAFNPPRPPESVGAKKKHRMLRWERRPADIEVDLNNYRKTVQRTRQELKSAENELERMETLENHLRVHFLQHTKCLNEELGMLNDEFAKLHQECVNSADLLTSRTRSRGAGKGSYAMRDVLNVLRNRGSEIEAKGLSMIRPSEALSHSIQGFAGVGLVSLLDWDRTTSVKAAKVARAWVLPGEKVLGPCGEGTILAFLPPSRLNTKQAPLSNDTLSSKAETKTLPKEDMAKKNRLETGDFSSNFQSVDDSGPLVASRVAVKLPFGIGYFFPETLMSREDPSTYTDDRLAHRWRGLYESAKVAGGVLDIEASDKRAKAVLHPTTDPTSESHGSKDKTTSSTRILPFNSELLPTALGRGNLLWNKSLVDLDKSLDPALYNSAGVPKTILGYRDNLGVPIGIRELERDCEERVKLHAQVLQLRNKLYRQRRTRILNEKTHSATQERAARVEILVNEMRTDLKHLKSRLDDEIRELGISEEEAAKILSAYYESLDSKFTDDASSHKRKRGLLAAEEQNDKALDEAGSDVDV